MRDIDNCEYYLTKCQLLVDLFDGNPPGIETTQKMIDDLANDGYLGKMGLTILGKEVAKVVKKIFEISEMLHEKMKKDLDAGEDVDYYYK